MENSFYSKVFKWLFIGLLTTFASGFLAMNSISLLKFLFSGIGYIIVIIAQLGLCVFLTARINKMQPSTAKICFVAYSILTGLTFSILFLMFKLDSIIMVFLVTALLFGLFAFIGKTTKMDLSKLGTFLLIGLIGVILLEVINIFLMNNSLNMIACILSIVIFLGYIAWDIQRVKRMNDSGENNDNYAIICAFELYLDFINVFIDLLRLFGKNKD